MIIDFAAKYKKKQFGIRKRLLKINKTSALKTMNNIKCIKMVENI